MKVRIVIEFDEAAEYILSHRLLGQYKKAKTYLIDGHFSLIDFKLRQPKKRGIYQFRINKKYRGFCYFREDGVLVVYKISDHQGF